jgi:GAF domain-containing protein
VVIPGLIALLIAASALTDGHYGLFHRRVAVSWTLAAVAAVLAVIEAAAVARRQLRVTAVVSERDEFRKRAVDAETAVVKLIRSELIALQERAHMFSSDRISLFRCDGDHFTLIGRRSARPLFDESLGRGRYPLDEGALGLAWAQGKIGVPSLPDPGPEGEPPKRRWLDAQRKMGIAEEVAAALRMRSQAYAAFRIADRERSFGVILFESTVAVDEAATAGASTTKRKVDELEPIVREASSRLAALLGDSSCLSGERVGELLKQQQGAVSHQR